MKILKFSILPISLSLIISGCATTTNSQREASVEDYRTTARKVYAMQVCTELGFADPQIVTKGLYYETQRNLGSSPNMPLLESAYNEAKLLLSDSLGEAKEYISKRENPNERTKKDEEALNNVKNMCLNNQQNMIAEINSIERQRRNTEIQNKAMKDIASALSNMGNMALEAGNSAMQATQPTSPSTQPSFGPTDNKQGDRTYLINTPGGIIQRNCVSSGDNHSYCF